ncbi:integrase arm-type DNA-binding domain-containing protein [Hyphomonas sp. GM-8P]|uniref:tyrosine-type recombinase/integrase n=1 Tax=Hyphomonas sp. GM-8P TaxID=1280945 RepID=UPI000DBF531F|nr:integrase arm-type DNA-binding domain-containing protein [Hyphomonas sp. GM-8P]RAN39064.1 integrase [Hyphomonas sp. GM-8P]
MKLTDTDIDALLPEARSYKRADGRGLYILVVPTGSKLWRMNYRFEGKQKTLSFGAWPIVTLEEAREKCLKAKRLLKQDIDPGGVRKSIRPGRRKADPESFNAIADEFLRKRRLDGLAETTLSKKAWLLDLAREDLGPRLITEIKPADVLAVLRSVEGRGNYETAKRLRTTIGEVFRYAVATLRAESDPTPVLRGALISPKVRHMPAITDEDEFGCLVRAIWRYEGRGGTAKALKLMALLFPRPGELRHARWSEFDFNKAVWTIPAERMKMRREHRKPLPPAALHLLIDLRGTSGPEDFVFPAMTNPERPMSENTMNGALERLGFPGAEMTPHGFRASASTLLNESGLWNPDAIEAELAHVDTKGVRSIYNRARYWAERVEMMSWWAGWVTRQTNGG